MKRVLAADPGLTTGWALYDPSQVPKAGQTEGPMEFLDLAHSWIEGISKLGISEDCAVVAERFIITPETAKKTQAPWSLEISGGLRFLCHRYGVPYIQQTPAEAKRLIHDDRLKDLGWYQPGRRHANDALRHLAYALVRRNKLRLPAAR